MAAQAYKYLIVGGGRAGASAVDGIRQIDEQGSILLIGNESELPYNRPPLTKDLWFGKKTFEKIFIHPQEYYTEKQAVVRRGAGVVSLDPSAKTVKDETGESFTWEKLLLATGGRPRHLTIPGSELDGICYYRYVSDYHKIRDQAQPDSSAVIIGGGFIGSEIAAALNHSGVKVTMVYPEDYLVSRVFPENLGRHLQKMYRERGIGIFAGNAPTAFEQQDGKFITHTKSGDDLESDILIVGAGIYPNVELAEYAGLQVENGIVVDEYLRASAPDIYAAGDNANFPYQALDRRMRIEHWDNALSQGKAAGRNMAGANEQFAYLPYFFSDLFEFGYEAVGDIDPRLEIFADWEKEFDTGAIYYMKDHRVRGVMLCNIWGKLDRARELISGGHQVPPEQLRGLIKSGKEAA
jgi:NADPH-dependent 2,4-dienoyl-CoA reductase/sulfur reductase-like enzyme